MRTILIVGDVKNPDILFLFLKRRGRRVPVKFLFSLKLQSVLSYSFRIN
ncbi:hypothetical protein SAMN05518847_1219 [Paenibacillus sp. OV219]|nr:hypothetical protein SAMN05518847_1219 [Paenibacillus sp. OV219]